MIFSVFKGFLNRFASHMKKDSHLFSETRFKEDERLVMSNHRIERLSLLDIIKWHKFNSVFGELKYSLNKLQNVDGDRVNEMIVSKTNLLFKWVYDLDRQKQQELLQAARKTKKRKAEEIRNAKIEAKVQKLNDARALTPYRKKNWFWNVFNNCSNNDKLANKQPTILSIHDRDLIFLHM